MNEGLSNSSEHVRLEYAEMAYHNSCRYHLTKSQIEQGLIDSSAAVRLVFAKRTDFIPNAEQIERGLTDVSDEIRRMFASRLDIQLTPAQIERGLIDTACMVRIAFAQRDDFVPSLDQIERDLVDIDDRVRFAFARRVDFTPSLLQVERGLKDKSLSVRLAFVSRSDFLPSDKKIERGLKDKSWEIRLAFAEHKNFNPTNEQIEKGLLDRSGAVRNAFRLKMNTDFCISPEYVELGLVHPDASVRWVFLNDFHGQLTSAQIERAKFDADSDVRATAFEKFGAQSCNEIPDDYVANLLAEFNTIPTWTSAKKKLQEQLYQLLRDQDYFFFTGSVHTYQISRFGDSVIFDVPENKTGNLKIFRAKRIRMICLEKYGPSGAYFAAKELTRPLN